MPIRLEPPLEHEFRLFLLGGDQADDVFAQALGDALFLDVGDESPFVILLRKIANRVVFELIEFSRKRD